MARPLLGRPGGLPSAPQSAWIALSHFCLLSLAASAAFFVALCFPWSFTVFASLLSLSVSGFAHCLRPLANHSPSDERRSHWHSCCFSRHPCCRVAPSSCSSWLSWLSCSSWHFPGVPRCTSYVLVVLVVLVVLACSRSSHACRTCHPPHPPPSSS